MSWASRRRFVIISILVGIVVVLASAIIIPIVYETPSCSDRKKNQDEAGIDCGGSCARVCDAQVLAPKVDFVRPLSPMNGRTDVIAYITNPNTNAAVKNARFTIELYGTDGTVIARKEGKTDLPPGATVPVYVPNFISGYLEVARAFLTFDQTSLTFVKYADKRIVPLYNHDAEVGGTAAPRIVASFTNPSATLVRDTVVIAVVFDVQGNAIAASQTLLAELPSQGSASVTFVWNEPFSSSPTRIDVIPVVPL